MNDPRHPQPGDEYTRNGRHYIVAQVNEPGGGFDGVVHLTCLDSPLPAVPGYKGGDTREARIYFKTLRREWTASATSEAQAA